MFQLSQSGLPDLRINDAEGRRFTTRVLVVTMKSTLRFHKDSGARLQTGTVSIRYLWTKTSQKLTPCRGLEFNVRRFGAFSMLYELQEKVLIC